MAGFKSGIFWGAVLGGLAGLMNAPRKGEDTRAALVDYLETAKADGQDLKYKADHLNNLIVRLQDQGLTAVQDLSKELQTDLRHFMENNQPRLDRIQRRLDLLMTHIEEAKDQLQSTDQAQ